MTRILQITDGIDTIDFENPASGYVIAADGWRPAVAQRTRSRLGGDPYQVVEEVFRLIISADSADQLATRLHALTRIIDRAESAWLQGGLITNPCLLLFRPEATTTQSEPLRALVLGGPASGEAITLPASYDAAGQATQIGSVSDPLILRIRRRGAWLAESASGTPDDPVTNPEVAEVDFGGPLDLAAPTVVAIRSDVSSGASAELPAAGYVLITSGSDRLFVADVGSVDDSANHALGGDVSRLQASSASSFATLAQASSIGGFDPPDPAVRRWAVFAALRASSSGPDWILRARVAGSFKSELTRELLFEPSGSPEIVALGTVTVDFPALDVIIQARALSSTSDYIYCDYVALLAADEYSRAIAFRRGAAANMTSTGLPIVIDPRALSGITGSVHTVHEDAEDLLINIPYAGNPYVVSGHRFVYAAVLATSGSSWRWRFDSANVQYDLAATRRPAYLVPR